MKDKIIDFVIVGGCVLTILGGSFFCALWMVSLL
jgi:hypothetical protein